MQGEEKEDLKNPLAEISLFPQEPFREELKKRRKGKDYYKKSGGTICQKVTGVGKWRGVSFHQKVLFSLRPGHLKSPKKNLPKKTTDKQEAKKGWKGQTALRKNGKEKRNRGEDRGKTYYLLGANGKVTGGEIQRIGKRGRGGDK